MTQRTDLNYLLKGSGGSNLPWYGTMGMNMLAPGLGTVVNKWGQGGLFDMQPGNHIDLMSSMFKNPLGMFGGGGGGGLFG